MGIIYERNHVYCRYTSKYLSKTVKLNQIYQQKKLTNLTIFIGKLNIPLIEFDSKEIVSRIILNFAYFLQIFFHFFHKFINLGVFEY